MLVTWDENTHSVERFWFGSYPIFKKIKIAATDELPPDLRNNIIRLFLSSSEPISSDRINEFKQSLMADGAFYFEIHTNDTSVITSTVNVDTVKQIEEEFNSWPSSSRQLMGKFLRENTNQSVSINWSEWC